jgi:hypothetical protein
LLAIPLVPRGHLQQHRREIPTAVLVALFLQLQWRQGDPALSPPLLRSILRFRSHQHPSRRWRRPPPPSFTLTSRILSASESAAVMFHQQVYSLPPPSCTHHNLIHSFCRLTPRGRFAVSSSLSGVGAFEHSLFCVFVGFNTTLEPTGYSGVRRKDA